MNTKINPEDFAKKFSKSKPVTPPSSKRLAKKLLLALTASLTLSSTHLAAQQFDNSNIIPPSVLSGTPLDYSQYNKKGATPRLIDYETFKKIKSAKMSGVFQHPLDKNSVITIEVEGDTDAERRIKADLNNLFDDESGYAIQKAMGGFVAGHYHKDLNNIESQSIRANQSFHAQNPTGLGRDINYSYLDTTRSHIPDKVADKNPEFNDYFIYHTYLHEIGHALKYQQLDVIDLTKTLFTDDILRHMEISADFSSSIQVYQDLTHYGVPEEDIIKYLDAFSDYRNHSAKVKLGYGELPHHLGQVATFIVKDMIKNSPKETLALSGIEIEKMSEVVFEMIENHNFAKDLNIALDSKIKTIMIAFQKDNVEDLPTKAANLVHSINKINVKEINIDNLSTMKSFHKIKSFPAFKDSVIDNMKARGLWKGNIEIELSNKYANETSPNKNNPLTNLEM